MCGLNKSSTLPHIIMPLVIISILVLNALACSISATPTEAALPTTQMVEATPLQEIAATQVVEEPEAVAPTADLGAEIVGFWKTKIIGKQMMIFEFQPSGLTVWHYRYNNGQKKDNSGTYSIQEGKVVTNFGEPQELAAQLEGTTLTLTGPDGKPLMFEKIANMDDPGPSASKNIAQDIVSRWQDTAVQEWMEFKADGTVSIQSSGNDLSGTYSVSGNTLEMRLDNQEKSSSFVVEIDGNVLTLYAEDGSFIDYVK